MQVLIPTERVFEQKCREIAEKQQCILLKVEKRKGWPDRMLLAPNGQMAWVELKRPGENPTKFQEHIHEMLRSMNFRVHVVENYSQFMAALVSLKALARPSGSPSIIK
jgi:hypothetical protein